jgi:rhodanese-related sulfurtransferase
MIAVLNKNEFASLIREDPRNDSRSGGYALVDISPEHDFEQRHFPNSLNIPGGQVEEFQRRFARDKTLCLCCNSRSRAECAKVAQALLECGFQHILQYDQGIDAWRRTSGGDPGAGDNFTVHLQIEAENDVRGIIIIDSD